jgi:hypothetical protein
VFDELTSYSGGTVTKRVRCRPYRELRRALRVTRAEETNVHLLVEVANEAFVNVDERRINQVPMLSGKPLNRRKHLDQPKKLLSHLFDLL